VAGPGVRAKKSEKGECGLRKNRVRVGKVRIEILGSRDLSFLCVRRLRGAEGAELETGRVLT